MHDMLSSMTPDELLLLDRYWDAANYLTVAQIYLQENALLREPLSAEQIKPRLLGHWGTSPGLSLVYVHLNRLIRLTGSHVLYIAGPGHGGPALVANVYLEGTYSEIYPRSAGIPPGCGTSCESYQILDAYPATWAPRPPVPSTRAANSATLWPTQRAPRWTTRA
jgi:xylulose-5-phosphate/fructose-6-phosphate phosphoketolase